ncbi:MAG: polymer-forming cytoskeletal protein [Salinivirgaceae bacterium]|nr:polymer-forming cytoskeletal protein [Salinivirgaceae bacterium]
MAKDLESLRDQINIIGSGTTIKGDIDCNGDMRIDGKVTGNINISGKIVVGTTGDINGQINCKNSEIEGKIEGKIFVAELLVLKSTASILGDITTTKLAIEPGATFTGNCKMDGKAQANAGEK